MPILTTCGLVSLEKSNCTHGKMRLVTVGGTPSAVRATFASSGSSAYELLSHLRLRASAGVSATTTEPYHCCGVVNASGASSPTHGDASATVLPIMSINFVEGT